LELNAGDALDKIAYQLGTSEEIAAQILTAAGIDPTQPLPQDVKLEVSASDYNVTVSASTMKAGIEGQISTELSKEDYTAALATAVIVTLGQGLGFDISDE